MPNFLIRISFYRPYPVNQTFRFVGSNFSAAIGKALRQWRKENKRLKIKEVNIKAIRL